MDETIHRYIVTLKLPKKPDHDPRNKKTGPCQFARVCTDVTGEHHSLLISSPATIEEIKEAYKKRGVHVTRVEQM